MTPIPLKVNYTRIWESVFAAYYAFCFDAERSIDIANRAVAALRKTQKR